MPNVKTGVQPYLKQNNQLTMSDPVILVAPGTVAASGITVVTPVLETDMSVARLQLNVSAKSGTTPTLDVTIQTSVDKASWRSVGTFDQKSDVGLAMGAVTSAGTTPPAITLTGTPDRYVDLKVIVGTAGARGVGTIKYSLDGGVTYSAAITTAATINVIALDGKDTGLVLNYANATSAADNVWTAKTAGREPKVFAGLNRFVRAVANVGGSASPSFTFGVTGELV